MPIISRIDSHPLNFYQTFKLLCLLTLYLSYAIIRILSCVKITMFAYVNICLRLLKGGKSSMSPQEDSAKQPRRRGRPPKQPILQSRQEHSKLADEQLAYTPEED